MKLITLQGVAKSFGPVAVIQGVSLAVKAGEFVSLLGPSGCGKTTLLRCIAGLESIDAGEIRIGDRLMSSAAVNVPPEERNIGFIFQSYALWPHIGATRPSSPAASSSGSPWPAPSPAARRCCSSTSP